MHIFKKLFFPIIVSLIIAGFTTYKAQLAYQRFHEFNMPVYDGVMNEKKQIESYIRFNNNFSLKERLNQVYWESKGNPLSAGFTCLVLLINPAWLANDIDVVLRGFLSLFIFSFVLIRYLKDRMTLFKSVCITILLSQLPFFYDYRIGIVSYVPELVSALFLFSGYLSVLIFFKSKQLIHLFTATILMAISIMFRFNFFVYVGLISLPLLYKAYSIVRSKSILQQKLTGVFISLLLIFMVAYIYAYFPYFWSYYSTEWSGGTPFLEDVTLQKSIVSFLSHLYGQLNLAGIVSLMVVFLFSNTASKQISSDAFVFLPFILLFLFIILWINAVDVPHVYSVINLSLVLFFTFSFSRLRGYLLNVSDTFLKFVFMLSLFFSNVVCWNTLEAQNTEDKYVGSRKVLEHIISDSAFSKGFKYISFYDEMEEIPIDVAAFKKTGVWLGSSNYFFLHNMFLYSISNSLKKQECVDYYISKLEEENYDLIVINERSNPIIRGFELANKVNTDIGIYLKDNPRFKIVKEIDTDYYGKLILYKTSSNNVQEHNSKL